MKKNADDLLAYCIDYDSGFESFKLWVEGNHPTGTKPSTLEARASGSNATRATAFWVPLQTKSRFAASILDIHIEVYRYIYNFKEQFHDH